MSDATLAEAMDRSTEDAARRLVPEPSRTGDRQFDQMAELCQRLQKMAAALIVERDELRRALVAIVYAEEGSDAEAIAISDAEALLRTIR